MTHLLPPMVTISTDDSVGRLSTETPSLRARERFAWFILTSQEWNLGAKRRGRSRDGQDGKDGEILFKNAGLADVDWCSGVDIATAAQAKLRHYDQLYIFFSRSCCDDPVPFHHCGWHE